MTDEELMKIAVDTALSQGAKEVIAQLIEEEEHQIRFSNSQTDIAKRWKRNYLDIFLTSGHPLSLGKKINTLTIHDPTPKKIKTQIPREVRVLRSLPKSKLYWGMDSASHSTYPSLKGLYDERIDEMPEKAPSIVDDTISASHEAGAKKVSGVLYFGKTNKGLLTSHGNGGVYRTSYCRATVRSFHDDNSSGQSLVVTRNLKDIDKKMIDAGSRAGRLAKRSAGGKEEKGGRYDLIMSPTVAGNIFGTLLSSANPIMMLGGMSCLKGKMDEQIGPDSLSVRDDPLVNDGMNSRPFDDEGTPSKRTPLIDEGVFSNLLHNTSTAKLWKLLNWIKLKFWIKPTTTSNSVLGQLGMTGSDDDPRTLLVGPSNYVFEPGTFTLNEMISSSKRPTIYMTSNWYTRFTNMREGKFSTVPRDAAFLIQDGEVKRPVRNLRLKGDLLKMCGDITGIGKDVRQIQWWEVSTPTFVPHIKVKDCTFTKAKS